MRPRRQRVSVCSTIAGTSIARRLRKQETWETNATAIAETVAFVEAIAKRYSSNDALLGISLLNEPTVLLLLSTVYHAPSSRCRSVALLLALGSAS